MPGRLVIDIMPTIDNINLYVPKDSFGKKLAKDSEIKKVENVMIICPSESQNPPFAR